MDTRGISEFLAAARAGTFTGAAQGLGVSVPHVSRQVARLEERLGTALFLRNTRRMTLTTAGEQLFVRCSEIADQFEGALEDVSATSKQLDGKLRIASLTGSFADQVVAPAVAQLAVEHPNLQIEVVYDAQVTDIVKSGQDIAIRAGQLADSDLVATPLASRVTAAAASPDYLEKHGVPQRPEDLVNHACITTHRPVWRFSQAGRAREQRVTSRLQTNSGASVVAAAKQGLGVAYIALGGYGEALSDGALQPILAPYWLRETSVHVLRAHRIAPARIRRAIDVLQQHARAAESRETALHQWYTGQTDAA